MEFEGRQRSGPAMMVLQNPELVERILGYLSGYKETLVSASLTAKAFSEPAFNVLWCDMPSFLPLFRILPTFERSAVTELYEFTGPVRNEHLHRVLYYAKRIRSLHFIEDDDSELGYHSRHLLISTFMRIDKLGAFFPLRMIYIHDPLCNMMLFPLNSPHLDKIEVRIKQAGLPEVIEIEFASFLQSVASQSPLLKCLVIKGPLRGFTLQVLPDFTKLERLTMRLGSPDIPELFLQQLASSVPSLRSLYIKTTAPNSAQRPQRLGQPHTIFRPSFPSLQTLDIKCDSSHLERIFGVLDAPLLKSVSLTLPQSFPDASADMHKFIERNGQVLKNIVHKVVIGASVDPSLSFIKVFEQLKELVVWASSGTMSMSSLMDTFNDDGSWSHSLTHLCLRQLNPNSLDCLSIAALCIIADACPNLNSLEISIIRPDEPKKQILTLVKKNGLERKPHYLKKLVFHNLPGVWDDSMPLAVEFVSFLEHLFPSVADLTYSGGKKDKPDTLAAREAWWRGVRLMWDLCQSIKNRKNDQPLSV